MFHSAYKKGTEKVVLLEVEGLIQIIVKFWAEEIVCVFVSLKILLRGMKYWLRKQLCSFENERLTRKQLCSFENERLTSFIYNTNLVHDFRKKYKVHISTWWCIHAPNVNKA